MKRYLVELEAGEREALEAITRKGSHSQKVLNALVLLNCDAGGATSGARPAGRSGVLRISARRVDRVKKRFVEDGLGAWGPANRRAIRGAPRPAPIRPRGARSGRSCRRWNWLLARVRRVAVIGATDRGGDGRLAIPPTFTVERRAS